MVHGPVHNLCGAIISVPETHHAANVLHLHNDRFRGCRTCKAKTGAGAGS